MNTVRKRKNISQNNMQNQEKAVTSREGSSSLLDRSKYTLDLVNSWINGADTKVSVSCGVFSVIIAAIVFAADIILGSIDKTDQVHVLAYSLFQFATIITVVTFLTSLFFHIGAINPSFLSGTKPLKKQSPKKLVKPTFSIFYDEIRTFENAADYVKAARETAEDQFTDEILKEVYYNSKICSKKMRRFKAGIIFAFITIVLSVITSILYYCAYTIN